MLMLKRIGAAVGAALLAIGILVLGVASPALANNCWIDPMTGKTVCDVVVTNPGDPGTSNPGGPGAGGPADFTPGPTKCVDNYAKPAPTEIPCNVGGDSWFDNERQCYWSLDDPQGPTTTHDPSTGAWYTCTFTASRCPPQPWAALACPSGGRLLPPDQPVHARAGGCSTRQDLCVVADRDRHGAGAEGPLGRSGRDRTVSAHVGRDPGLVVGEQPTPSSWGGPQSKTATLGGGVTVTANASVQSLYWNSGDGQNVTCGAGTPFNAAAYANQAAVDSPTCGIRYQHTTKGGTFTVTATTSWVSNGQVAGSRGRSRCPRRRPPQTLGSVSCSR